MRASLHPPLRHPRARARGAAAGGKAGVRVALATLVALAALGAEDAGAAEPAAGGVAPAGPLPCTFGLAFTVAEPAGTSVVPDAWLDAQVAEAERLFGAVGVHFRWVIRKAGKKELGRVEVETREDRDAFQDQLEQGYINVFVVRSLRDVDEPPRMRMGVTWTQRETKRRYVVLSSIAKPSVLAHELGHFFGNGHTTVTNNLMSYDRDGGVVFLSEEQRGRIAERATGFAKGALLVLGPPRAYH